MSDRTIDSIPVAYTPDGGWTEWPAPILSGCTEPIPEGAPDLDGWWQTYEVIVDGEIVPDHPALWHVSRKEHHGERVIVTAAGIIHDMRCDGTLENGVHDVAEFDKSVEIHVVAGFEDGVHVLRPEGMPIEVRRWREGDDLLWQYIGFTARMRKLAPSHADARQVMAGLENE